MIFAVARNRLWNLRHDRAALLLSFGVPIVFFSVFAFIFGGESTRSVTRKVPVAVVDEDETESSRRFVAILKAENALAVSTRPEKTAADASYTAASAEAAVRSGTFSVALVIPKGFGAHPVRFGPSSERPRVEILSDPSDPIAPQVVAGLVQKVAATAMTEGTRGVGVIGGLVDVQRRDVLGQRKRRPMIAFYAAGLGVMFLLFSAAGAGGALIEEVESGTLDRILSTRVDMTSLLAGKLVYLAGLAAAQLLVMFVWGAIAFGLEMRGHWLGFAVMTAATALAASTFGLLLAAICRSRMQLVAFSNLIVLVMSAVGGSMFPRFLMPEFMQKIGLLTLNAWAIDGFQKVFWREEPIGHLWPQVLVLAAIAAVFFLTARRVARKWETA